MGFCHSSQKQAHFLKIIKLKEEVMTYPNETIWTELPKAHQSQVIAIMVQIILRQLRKKEKEVKHEQGKSKDSS